MITDELRALLDPMDEADLYEVSYYLIRLRREMRKREERRREEAREEESREKELPLSRARTRGEFVKPTVEEVADYCRKNGYKIDPIKFVTYYETRGWIVGKTRMKNWHSAVALWVRNGIAFAERDAADRKAREKRFNSRSSGWTPPPISDKYKEAQLAELRKAGF